MRQRPMACFTLAVVVLRAATFHALSDEAVPGGVTVLDTSGFWRLHHVLRPPVFTTGEGLAVSETGYHTALPPAEWTSTDFDDSRWLRAPGQPFPPVMSDYTVTFKENAGFINTHQTSASLALTAMRGKFFVNDPSRVPPLFLSIEYRGGIVVYLNGREVTRANAPGGMESLADAYPLDAWLNADGSLLQSNRGEDDEDTIRRWRLRTRQVENIAVPADFIQSGVNVLAIESRRSPYPKEVIDKMKAQDSRTWSRSNWSTCGVRHVRLTAGSGSGLVPNTARPEGLQAWNSDLMQPDFDLDWGDPNEPLRPVRIVAARNGGFSGKVIVGSHGEIRQLRAKMSDLRSGDSIIPATAVELRYANLLGATHESGARSRYRVTPDRFDALLSDPPEVIPVREKEPGRGNVNLRRAGQPTEVFGAVAPIWLTVNVPRDARPGVYKGTLEITAGSRTLTAPVEVEVYGYVLPAPENYRTVVDLVHSPESVALQYGVPLWSDRHFELIARTNHQLGRIGNASMYVHLTAETNMGNAESIVRWKPRPGGGYEHDFSFFDRYLDTVVENMGKPKMIVLYIWDYHLAKRGHVPVTAIDPSGKTYSLELPLYDTDGGAALWQPVADYLLAELKKKGLSGTAVLGPLADSAPPREVADRLTALFDGAPWMRHAHSERRNIHNHPIAYQALVWTPRWPERPDEPSMRGWNRDEVIVQFMRSGEETQLTIPRLLGEMNIIGQQKGFGRIGADFWPVLEISAGRGRTRKTALVGRYPESGWQNLEWMTRFMLAPGPDGPVSTTRYEMMREGVLECQAVILLEDALLNDRISGDLADRCRKLLRDRLSATLTALDCHLNSGLMPRSGHSWWSNTSGQLGSAWFVGSGWQDRSAGLFELAGEVQAAGADVGQKTHEFGETT